MVYDQVTDVYRQRSSSCDKQCKEANVGFSSLINRKQVGYSNTEGDKIHSVWGAGV